MTSITINDDGLSHQVVVPSRYFLLTDGELKKLPRARLGDRTNYCDLNDRGWLAGYVKLDGERVRGFVARPW